jgi:phosphoribosylanthranilate isomerase
LTSLSDAFAAIEAGADMLGFNFYPPSPRCISPEACVDILLGLQGRLQTERGRVQTVGVFVNMPPAGVSAVLERCGLDLAQLSGNETPEDLEVIGLERAFKVLRSDGESTLVQTARDYPRRSEPPAYLVDAYVPGQFGGTGRVVDWSAARELALRLPVMLAGGLQPGNVAGALRAVQPWGVDVASGIESAPGIKDIGKMQAFARAVRTALLKEEV